MVILPAIDLLDGKVVRLTQGKREQVTVYSADPLAIAEQWKAAGAAWLHVVDLNGALDGAYSNLPIAARIIRTMGLSVELSGGIRTRETLQRCLEAGAARVVLGTKACEDLEFVKVAATRNVGRVAVAIDARAGQVVSRGWQTSTSWTPAELARTVVGLGVKLLICTDVSRDGMLQGPNTQLLTDVLDAGAPQVIASGGIASLEQLRQLLPLEPKGVIGAIIGKALYDRQLDLREAMKLLGNQQSAVSDW